MKSEYRGVVAIALSAAFFILWFTVISPPPKKQPAPAAQEQAQTQTENATAQAAATDATKAAETKKATEQKAGVSDPQAALPIKTVTLKNERAEIEFTNDGGVPTSWKILKYRETTSKDSPPINLVSEIEGVVRPLTLSFEGANFEFPENPRFSIAEADDTHVKFVWRSKEAEIAKTITIKPDSYLAELAIDVKNLTDKPLTGKPAVVWSGVILPVKKSGGFLSFLNQQPSDNKTPVYYIDGSVVREMKIGKEGERVEKQGAVLWSGIESRYFLSALIPRIQGEGLKVEFGKTDLPKAEKGTVGVWAGAALPSFTSIPDGTTSSLFSLYAGPKDIEDLKSAGVKLDAAIDYGWFTVIAVPILYLLKFFYSIINNYGVAIILLTIFVKLLLHPINVKSLKSMKAMQQLQPRLKELQKKFKDDKARLNQETMQLFRAHKVNPMGGCLPMLLQFPIYIALYKVLWNSIELYHAPFFWFYRDLSAPDPYFITPILLGIFMVAQQKLMPSTSADPAQQKMMMLMPIMFSVFMLFLPVGLVVYILVNTVMSVTQQYMYNHGIGIMDLVRGRFKKATA